MVPGVFPVSYRPILNIVKTIITGGGGALTKLLSTGAKSVDGNNNGLNITENIRSVIGKIDSEVFVNAFKALSSELQRMFIDDFIDRIDHVHNFFHQLPDAINYWKEVLLENKKFRRNIDYLQNCDDYVKRSPSNSIDEINVDLSEFVDDPRIYLDELGNSAALPSQSGVWELGPFRRGNEIENHLDAFIPGDQTIPKFPKVITMTLFQKLLLV